MAATITSCKRKTKTGDTASVSTGGESDACVYTVEVAEALATPLEVVRATHASMPAYGSVHTLASAIKVTNKTATRVGANAWEVSVSWGVPTNAAGGGQQQTGDTENSQNIVVRVSGQETPILTQNAKDSAKTPVRNSVGDLYPDPWEVYDYDEVIAIDYEKITFDIGSVAGLRGKINSNPVNLNLPQGALTFSRTFAKHTVLFKTCDYGAVISKSDPSATKWGISTVLLYRADTWNFAPPQKGYRWKDANNKLTEWKDHAEYLDGYGKRLADGSPLVALAPVQRYTEADLLPFLSSI